MKTYPSIEPLEARIAPAVFIVNTTADTTGVPGHTSLRDALADADSHSGHNSIIFKLPSSQLTGGAFIIELTQGELTSTGDVTITGPGAGKLIIDAQGNSRIFDISDSAVNHDRPVSISGMTLVNGQATGNGGAILTTESLSLANVNLTGNSATEYGGAVEGVIENFSVTKCVMSHNSAGADGGALDVVTGTKLQVSNSTLSGNTSGGVGGGAVLGVEGGNNPVVISGDAFTDNTATDAGGGLFTSGHAAVANSIFSGNSAQSGGGLCLNGGGVPSASTIKGSTFADNSANVGGGIYLASPTSATISGVTAIGNRATGGRGGGLYVVGPSSTNVTSVSVTGSHFDANSATGNGGGVAATDGVNLKIGGTTINANHAGGGGGGLMVTGSGDEKVTLTISGGKVSDNFSSGVGGGMYAVGDGAVTISGTTFTSNSADAPGGGGGLCLNSTSAVKLAGIIVSGNELFGSNYGGGLYDDINGGSATLEIVGGSFIGNLGALDGGGIFLAGAGNASIVGATIAGNIAITGGGIFNNASGVETLIGGIVADNIATTDPNLYNI
jgi:predicted outer membrane repeat protein